MKEGVPSKFLLDQKSLFWTPDYVEASAWVEHIPFAFWIMEVAQPKVVVELGVHKGTSYFAFCQAVKHLNLDAVCYGVDTWQGDAHTGFYEEDVFSKVTEYNQKEYASFSTLLRSTFDEAAAYFIDGTIDLLHIDGLHTYEAVKHDFETWLPKLSPNAFVLFHDINVRERNFGVFKFWEEVQQQYQTFQFNFGYGLGVLSLGHPIAPELYRLLDGASEKSYHSFLRNLFADRGHAIKFKFMLEQNALAEKGKSQRQALELAQQREAYKVLEEKHVQLQAGFKALTQSFEQAKEHVERLEAIRVKLEKNNTLLAEISEKEDMIVNNTDTFSNILKDLMQKFENHEKLVAEKDALQNELAWYKRTYENRSILGLLKSRLTK